MTIDKQREDQIIGAALHILERRFNERPVVNLNDPQDVKNFLVLKLANLEHETFGVIYLDVKNRLIGIQELFRGTVDGCPVYPREVVKDALAKNATIAILYHNHPGGDPNPSPADFTITQVLVDALHIVGIRVADHIIVARSQAISFTETGMIDRIKRP